MISPRKTIIALYASSLIIVIPCDAFSPRQQQISRGRPLNSFDLTVEAVQVSSAVNSFFQTEPYLAGFLTCSFKASAADMIAQKQECRDSTEKMTTTPLQEDNTDIDIFRNLGFLFYGGLYQGMAQNYLYNVLYPSWFGTDDSSLVLIQEVLADNLIFAPLLCLPVAYAFKAAFTSQDLSLETFKKGLERYIEDVTSKGLLMQYWKIWVPGQFLTFGIIPPHFRVVFVAAISFFWICILSQISSSASETNVQAGVSLE